MNVIKTFWTLPVILHIMFLATLIFMLPFLEYLYETGSGKASWPETTATITQTEIVKGVDKKTNKTFYSAKVNYTYSLNEKEYTGANFYTHFYDKAKADKYQQESIGQEITIYYDSKDPYNARFEFPINAAVDMFLIVGILFMIVVFSSLRILLAIFTMVVIGYLFIKRKLGK